MAILFFKGNPVITKDDAAAAEDYIAGWVRGRLLSMLNARGMHNDGRERELLGVDVKLLRDNDIRPPHTYQYATIDTLGVEIGWGNGRSKGAYVPTFLAIQKRLEKIIPDHGTVNGKAFMLMEPSHGHIRLEVWGGSLTEIPGLRRAFEVRKDLESKALVA